MFRESRALEFAQRVGGVRDTSEISIALESLIADFGFCCFSAGRIASKARRTSGKIWALSAHPWLAHWQSGQYAKLDPIVWYWRSSPGRTLAAWSEIKLSDCGPRSDIFDEASAFGLHEGLAVGLQLSSRDYAAISLGTTEDSIAEPDRLAAGFAALACAARFEALERRSTSAAIVLTSRERECLTWIATGKRDGEISDILGIAESTITLHVKNAVRKLEAGSRSHAVALAVMDKLIEL